MVQAEPPGGGPALLTPDGVTVHLVGRLTPAVLSFLLPAIDASFAAGRRQALLFINNGVSQVQLAAVPTAVHRVDVRDSESLLVRCDALFKALLQFSLQHPINVLHVHGLLPALAGARLLRTRGDRGVDVLFSPHSSRVLGWTLAKHAVFGPLRRLSGGNSAVRVIANVQREARLLAPYNGLAVQVIDCPVARVFFDTARKEAARPLVVSCNLECHHAALDGFQRVAVLLNDDRLGIDFNWIGNTEADGVEALRAAGVACFEASTSSSRADRFSTAWVYVATYEERGFPIHLVEAMAAGIPCVALDTEIHRSMIVPGETGYLYRTAREMLERIGQLVDSQPLRHRVGQAARRMAELRFSEAEFQRRFWHAVSPNAKPTTPEPGMETSCASEPCSVNSPTDTQTCS